MSTVGPTDGDRTRITQGESLVSYSLFRRRLDGGDESFEISTYGLRARCSASELITQILVIGDGFEPSQSDL
jgi:hypothetical protein